MNYILNLKTGTEITLGLPYGNVTFKHGQIVPESIVTRSFPQYFNALPDPEYKPALPVDDIISKIKANIEKGLQGKEGKEGTEGTKETPKRKAGRPSKKGFSRG